MPMAAFDAIRETVTQWWTHSLLASIIVPTSAHLWRRRLSLVNDPHRAEVADLRRRRQEQEARVRSLSARGVLGAARKDVEAGQ